MKITTPTCAVCGRRMKAEEWPWSWEALLLGPKQRLEWRCGCDGDPSQATIVTIVEEL